MIDVAKLPRLLYLGDVPVESSYHGSALIYRLLQNYPAEKLRIIESNLRNSLPERRLQAIVYTPIRFGWTRPLYTRVGHWARLAYSYAACWKVRAVEQALGDFEPEAVLTVAHDFLWLTAARYARKHSLPLHLICHDDWPRLAIVPAAFRRWLDREFGRVYRQAASRLCVSPGMAEEYERRYGGKGTVLYPSRADDCPVFDAAEARSLSAIDELVIGYGGNCSPDMMSCLRDLAGVLSKCRARLVVFGPFSETVKLELLAISQNVTFCGLVPFKEMITKLRATADLLFVPMSFSDFSRENMAISFPSKLTDYTATGLPLLIYGPSYCSAVSWSRNHPDVAEIVETSGASGLSDALNRLKQDPCRRSLLANRSIEIGQQYFSSLGAQQCLYDALSWFESQTLAGKSLETD